MPPLLGVFLLHYLNTMGQWMGNHAPVEMELVMSKVFQFVCQLLCLVALFTPVGCFLSDGYCEIIMGLLDFTGSPVVVAIGIPTLYVISVAE
jgi:hypothetical protein